MQLSQEAGPGKAGAAHGGLAGRGSQGKIGGAKTRKPYPEVGDRIATTGSRKVEKRWERWSVGSSKKGGYHWFGTNMQMWDFSPRSFSWRLLSSCWVGVKLRLWTDKRTGGQRPGTEGTLRVGGSPLRDSPKGHGEPRGRTPTRTTPLSCPGRCPRDSQG